MAKLHFYFSAMNAGKSTTLLQSSHNYNERGMRTVIFAPARDDRYGVGKVSTRIGLQSDAAILQANDNVYTAVARLQQTDQSVHCVLIDEAQFLTKEQVLQLTFIVDRLSIPVLAYGLRSDFRGEPFPGSLYLLTWADNLVELKTICHCGKKAGYNMRIDADGIPVKHGEQIQIGGNESYMSTCRAHFYEALGIMPEQITESI